MVFSVPLSSLSCFFLEDVYESCEVFGGFVPQGAGRYSCFDSEDAD